LKIRSFILATSLFIGNFLFGQTKNKIDFSFKDKFDCSINIKLYSDYPKPIDSVFLVNNINCKLFFSDLDTIAYKYLLSIFEIKSFGKNTFKIKVHSKWLANKKKSNDSNTSSTIILSHNKKSIESFSSFDIYIMVLRKDGNNYIIQEFKYLESQI
jgi:hypothetical protein